MRAPMFIVLIILVFLMSVGALIALIRVLFAFSREEDRIKGGDDAYLRRGKQQNRTMTQRVIFQAMAVLAVTALGLLFSAH
nr:hypothetical protein TQ38_20485 [Novosphingobium sp. P6W]